MERYLGIDYGTVRVGLAVGSILAEELTTLPNKENISQTIAEIVAQEEITTIVVGEPIRSRGESGTMSQGIDQFIEELGKHIPDVPIKRINEAFTTAQGKLELEEAGVTRPDAEKRIDQYAAKLLLQEFIDMQSESA